nr:MAG TPA: hypothetical protein [Caudoviricetes sp.]
MYRCLCAKVLIISEKVAIKHRKYEIFYYDVNH